MSSPTIEQGRAARTVARITGNVMGEWAVESGWLARARTILEVRTGATLMAVAAAGFIGYAVLFLLRSALWAATQGWSPRRSGLGGPGGPGLAFASGSLWVANTTEQQVARVESDADPVIIPVRGSPNAIVAAQDTAWVAARTPSGGGLVARIDAGASQVGHTIPLRHPPTGLAITLDGGTVWVATAADRTVHRIDSAAGRVVKPIELPQAPDQAVYGDGAVWVTSTTGDAVMRIDAGTSKVGTPPIRVGNGPGGIAFGADRVWVANSRDGTVSWIDPQTNEVGTQRLGFRPTAVAVEERAVWVALAA